MIESNGGLLRFGSLNDTASAFTNENILILDHDTGNVGIGTTSPATKLHLSSSNINFRLESTTLNSDNIIQFVNSSGAIQYTIFHDTSQGRLKFRDVDNRPFFEIIAASNVGVFNNDALDIDFRFEGDTDTNLLRTDAGNGRVGIGTGVPTHLLNVDGDVNITEGNTLLNGRNVLHAFSTIPSATFTTTPINITWSGETVDGSFYSHTQGFSSTNVTVLRSGLYKITADASIDVDTGSARSVSRAYLVDDNVEITGTSCFMYNRIAGNGDQSCSITTIRALSADSEIQLRVERHTGSDTLIATANSNRITFEYLGETG